MEPVIAVFASRNSAEQAVNELLKQDVPKQAVAVLTAAEEQSRIVAGQLGTYVGILAGFGAGMSLGLQPHCASEWFNVQHSWSLASGQRRWWASVAA